MKLLLFVNKIKKNSGRLLHALITHADLEFMNIGCKEGFSSQGMKISHDVASGVIQMTVDHFTRANEGTYTVQIHDGKAKTQSSLVLVGDGEAPHPRITHAMR